MKKSYRILFVIAILLSACKSSKSISNSTFSSQQTALIMNFDETTPMRVFKITNQRDSILLRTKSEDVNVIPNDPVLKRFVSRLHTTVQDSISLGVGIAAPQVGILKNIILVQRFDIENMPFEVYLNPVITYYSEKKQTRKEGCLSIPNRTETLNTRAFSINLEYDTLKAEHKTETVEGFTAIIFQHEVDHLNGILYLDHLNKEVAEAKAKNDTK